MGLERKEVQGILTEKTLRLGSEQELAWQTRQEKASEAARTQDTKTHEGRLNNSSQRCPSAHSWNLQMLHYKAKKTL